LVYQGNKKNKVRYKYFGKKIDCIKWKSFKKLWCSDHFIINCLRNRNIHVIFIMSVMNLKIVDFIADVQPISDTRLREFLIQAKQKDQQIIREKQSVELWVRKKPYFKNPDLLRFIHEMEIKINDLTSGVVKFSALTRSFIKMFKHRYVMPCFPDDHDNILAKLPEWIENYNQLADEKFNDNGS